LSLVVCPVCKGTFGVRRIPRLRKIGKLKPVMLDRSDRFKCLDCGHEFTAEGKAAIDEIGQVASKQGEL
jgi:transposase-like protein